MRANNRSGSLYRSFVHFEVGKGSFSASRDGFGGSTKVQKPEANGTGPMGIKGGQIEQRLEIGSRRLPSPDVKKGAAPERPPEFVVKPRRQFVDEGQTARFKVSFEGSPSTSLTWTKDGKPLTGSRFKTYEDGGYHFLEISDVTGEDSGLYLGVISNIAGADTASAELEVFCKPKLLSKAGPAPPIITKPLQDMQLVVGDHDVKLTCEVTGDDVTASWFHNGAEVRQGRQHKCRIAGRMASLTLTEIREADRGRYECVLSNQGGQVRSCCTVNIQEPEKFEPPVFVRKLVDMEVEDGDKVEVIVEVKEVVDKAPEPPDFVARPRNVTVEEGQDANFTCYVKGQPTPLVTWERDGERLKSDQKYELSKTGHQHWLKIRDAHAQDAGLYECHAKNTIGGISHFVSLVVTSSASPSSSSSSSSKIVSRLPASDVDASVNIVDANVTEQQKYSVPLSVGLDTNTAVQDVRGILRKHRQHTPHPPPPPLPKPALSSATSKLPGASALTVTVTTAVPSTTSITATSSTTSTNTTTAVSSASRWSCDPAPKVADLQAVPAVSAHDRQSSLTSLTRLSSPLSPAAVQTSPPTGVVGRPEAKPAAAAGGVRKNLELFEKRSSAAARPLGPPKTTSSGRAARRSPARGRGSRNLEDDVFASKSSLTSKRHSSAFHGTVSRSHRQEIRPSQGPFGKTVNADSVVLRRSRFEQSFSEERKSGLFDGHSRVNQILEHSDTSRGRKSNSLFTVRSKSGDRFSFGDFKEHSLEENSIKRRSYSSSARESTPEKHADDHLQESDSVVSAKTSGKFGPAIEALKAELAQEQSRQRLSLSPGEETSGSRSTAEQEDNLPPAVPSRAPIKDGNLLDPGSDSTKITSKRTDARSEHVDGVLKQKHTESTHRNHLTKANPLVQTKETSSDSLPWVSKAALKGDRPNYRQSVDLGSSTGKVDFRSVLKPRAAEEGYRVRPLSKEFKASSLSKSTPDFLAVLNRIRHEEEDEINKKLKSREVERSGKSDYRERRAHNSLSTSTTDLIQPLPKKPVNTATKDIGSIKSKFESPPTDDFRTVQLKSSKSQAPEVPLNVPVKEEKVEIPKDSAQAEDETADILQVWKEKRKDRTSILGANESSVTAAVGSVKSEVIQESQKHQSIIPVTTLGTTLPASSWIRTKPPPAVVAETAVPSSVATLTAAATTTTQISTTVTTVQHSEQFFDQVPVLKDVVLSLPKDEPDTYTVDTGSVDEITEVSSELAPLSGVQQASLPHRLLAEVVPKGSESSQWSDKDSAYSTISTLSKISDLSDFSDSGSPKSDAVEVVAAAEPRNLRRRLERLPGWDGWKEGEEGVGGGRRRAGRVEEWKRKKEGSGQAPAFSEGLEDRRVQYGGQVVLQCQVSGVPEPEVSWRVNDRVIKPSKFFQLRYAERVAQLVVAEAFSEDEGEYTCTASNSAGTDSTSCYITVEASSTRSSSSGSHVLEGPVSTPAHIVKLTPSTLAIRKGQPAYVEVTFVGAPLPSVQWFHRNTLLASNERCVIMSDAHSSSLTIAASELSDSGRYTIIVTNDLGTDLQYANIGVEDVPEAPMGKPHVYDISKHSVSLSWCGPPYDGGCVVTHYVIEGRTTTSQEWSTLVSDCQSTSHHIQGLNPLQLYEFRVRAVNKHGVSPPSLPSDKVMMADPLRTSEEVDESSDDELPFEPRNVQLVAGRKFEDHYEYLDEVGRGKFGCVYKCREKATGRLWAAKVLKVREKEKDVVRQEMAVMNMLAHPKLLMLWDAFEAPKTMVLVMEFVAAGELFERVIREDFVLTERDCVHFVRQICAGVGYMHSRGILHLDLKPENVLCVAENSNQIKIIDFGLARFYQPGDSCRVLMGTPEFIAPEVINYDEIGFATDMWSIGVICYILLSGLSPFLGETDAETLANVTRGDYDFDDDSFDVISDDAKDFIAKLLVKRKEKRNTIEQCEKHSWLQQEKLGGRCKRLNTERLRCFMARRKWQKAGNAFRALGRMTSLQRLMGGGGSGSGSPLGSRQSSSSSLLSLHDLPGTPLLTAATASLDGSASPLTASTCSASQALAPAAASALSHPDSSPAGARRLGQTEPAGVCSQARASTADTLGLAARTAVPASQTSPAELDESVPDNSSPSVPSAVSSFQPVAEISPLPLPHTWGEGGRGLDVGDGDDESSNSCGGGRGQAEEGDPDVVPAHPDISPPDVTQDSSALFRGDHCSRTRVPAASSSPSSRRRGAWEDDDVYTDNHLEAWRRKRVMKTGDWQLANQMGSSQENRGVSDTPTSSSEPASNSPRQAVNEAGDVPLTRSRGSKDGKHQNGVHLGQDADWYPDSEESINSSSCLVVEGEPNLESISKPQVVHVKTDSERRPGRGIAREEEEATRRAAQGPVLGEGEKTTGPSGAPRFLKTMADCQVFAGDAVRFDVQVSGCPPPRVVWTVKGEEVREGGPRWAVERGEEGRCGLIVRHVTEADEGLYACRATNGQGEATCTAQLSVYGHGAF